MSKLDVLSEEIWYYHRSIAQGESVLSRKLHLRDVLYYAISPCVVFMWLARHLTVLAQIVPIWTCV
ncbi:unnamed protein product [Gongylonema pulchrum]|uniref:Uncharacterized protein n=1 Tax=Gongylonema pulchrum TaxID=637853 RepID=A0A3P6PZS4_9BILA|nr:unnamed protein product [Gongylonema pulchrum]